jgi:hypothetical protein
VPRAELACGKVGDDVDGMVAQPGRPALRFCHGQLLAWPPAGASAWRGESFPHASYRRCSRRVSWTTHQSESGGAHARRRLVV